MGHTHPQWHGLEADFAERRNRLLLYSEKVNSMISTANQKHHVGPLVKCKEGGKWLKVGLSGS